MIDTITVDLSRFDWQGVSAVSDALMVLLNIILIISVVIGYRSLKESVLSRDAPLLTWAMERMSSIKDDLDILQQAPPYGTIEQIKSTDYKSPWSAEVESAAYRVSVELQRLSYLANSGLISKVHLRKMWGGTITMAWALLVVWVKHRRVLNGEAMEIVDGGITRNDLEKFARECAELYHC